MKSQAAFVLQQRNFKNTSKILELFTEDFGRVSVVAKGLSRPKSPFVGILQLFTPLQVEFSGKSELKTLIRAETSAASFHLSGLFLYCGFYLNELLLKLLPKEIEHKLAFAAYQMTLMRLSSHHHASLTLRYFEILLLQDLGFGLDLRCDKNNNQITADKYYILTDGFCPTCDTTGISGQCLLDLISNKNEISKNCLRQLKLIMRQEIDKLLNGKPLKSRMLIQDYMKLQP